MTTFQSVCTENSVAAPREDERLVVLPGEVAGEPLVLRVVEQSDETAAFEPHEYASDPADVFRETPAGLAHEALGRGTNLRS